MKSGNREERSRKLQKSVLLSLIPAHFIKLLASSYGFLAIVIFFLAFIYKQVWIESELFLILLATVTLVSCLNGFVGGYYLFSRRNPYLEEWKEKFGYYEK